MVLSDGPGRNRPDLNAATAKIDEQVYLLNYRNHYAEILGDHATPVRLAELFLFRAWTTQFGFRIFSADAASSEKLMAETINSCRHLGLGVFEKIHGFSVETELGGDFFTLLEDRWQTYDKCVITSPDGGQLPLVPIITAVTNRLGLADPMVTYQLSYDFANQIELIKATALELGLLA